MSNVYRHKDGSYRDYPEHGLRDEHSPMYITSSPITNQTELIDEISPIQQITSPHKSIEFKLKESEKNIGKKHDQGKQPIHMIPEDAILGMAEAFAYGAKKYNRFNYKNGLDYTRLTDSLMRHTLAFLKGEDIDPESGLHHTKLMLANTAMLEFMRLHKPEHDDRYKNDK
jgi:hypothetical protein